ncbi:hypothetical protein KO500_10840 [Cellulophaga baltica]|uniref:PKD domain-containing protein n=1 Tax=Cellulophaga TaxID=104264 RepID=UPI001C0748EF|nr:MULTISPECIES: PKD domain-containing protein [Cellulophaga]MBU2996935.1 hypothetical protein [Cellulophaga baltica]MDO6768333.1 hypothetical protein [Cellulophaga sp. 1_MG-2023]
MKALKYFLSTLLVVSFIWSCEEDEFGSTDFVNNIEAPVNVAASVSVTQDNTGLVTITPSSSGAVSYTIDFGDNSDSIEGIIAGNSAEHNYAEGTYQAIITAVGINGLTTSVVQEITVSFNAPENLVVTIENDAAITKQVNVTAIADYATSYEVYFGESADETPVEFGTEETVSYQYEEAGTYTITVIAMSAAIETLEYSEEFLVTEILQPVVAVATPTSLAANVISVFSDEYTDPDPIDYYPDWGQSTTYTQIEVEGNNIIQYGDLTYQGINFDTAAIDASEMEFIHVDIWTADDNFDAKISPISSGPFEAAYDLELNANEWTSFDIPISYFTEANASLDFSNIIQFKFDGVDSGTGSIFVDNLYFYKQPSLVLADLTGTWKMSSEAGSLGVGPSVGDISWWNCDESCITERLCYYDDSYVFNEDGSFQNILDSETWVEGWQGGSDSCGTPVAPHDGSASATYIYDETAGTVTINGTGAYIGLAKATNTGELTDVADTPAFIIYNISFIDTNTISVYVEAGSGVFWQYKLVRI